jgi:hypothetical protein
VKGQSENVDISEGGDVGTDGPDALVEFGDRVYLNRIDYYQTTWFGTRHIWWIQFYDTSGGKSKKFGGDTDEAANQVRSWQGEKVIFGKPIDACMFE